MSAFGLRAMDRFRPEAGASVVRRDFSKGKQLGSSEIGVSPIDGGARNISSIQPLEGSLVKLLMIALLASSSITASVAHAGGQRQTGPVFTNYGQCQSSYVQARRTSAAVVQCRVVAGGYSHTPEGTFSEAEEVPPVYEEAPPIEYYLCEFYVGDDDTPQYVSIPVGTSCSGE